MKYIFNKIKKVNQHIERYIDTKNNFLLKITIYFDILYSILRYGMNLDEYFQYKFFGKRHYEKKSFFVYRKRMLIVNKYNSFEDMKIFDEKPLFNQEFKEFVNRRWMNIKNNTFDEFVNFTESFREFIVKPSNGYYGLGVRKESINNEVNLRDLYKKLVEEEALIEEVVSQLDDIAEFNPSSVNTLRVVTMNQGQGRVEVTTANLRVGNGVDKCADNFHHGGIASLIDIETGIVKTTGIDKYLNTYVKHPISGKQIVGYAIPYWNKVKETVKEAALIKPTVGYVGWDVAIGKDGKIIIIEGNPKADPDVSQLPDGKGKWHLYKKFV
ncbi:sugar-transfer associated ATP-grasp domain-containing protein [Evansella clarkii]|uniref:sugar-transfer associated ATP-grasp domain-containing protein n=1 Tax=Evansella clarkii TaxID=79879 RepID=UPI000997C13E|nr:sugar-transfer associated ATP-grasp domain-containing protein [Evansella clarkii]